MSDALISRLDNYVIALLDESEGVTKATSEEPTGSPPERASITERVACLKAACQYLALRERLDSSGEGSGAPVEEREPGIVSLERAIKGRAGQRRGGR